MIYLFFEKFNVYFCDVSGSVDCLEEALRKEKE